LFLAACSDDAADALRAEAASLDRTLAEKQMLSDTRESRQKRDHALLQPASDLVANLDPPRTMQLRLAPNQFDLR
jgi:hypothetical protein